MNDELLEAPPDSASLREKLDFQKSSERVPRNRGQPLRTWSRELRRMNTVGGTVCGTSRQGHREIVANNKNDGYKKQRP
jgi:hypothetical protein